MLYACTNAHCHSHHLGWKVTVTGFDYIELHPQMSVTSADCLLPERIALALSPSLWVSDFESYSSIFFIFSKYELRILILPFWYKDYWKNKQDKGIFFFSFIFISKPGTIHCGECWLFATELKVSGFNRCLLLAIQTSFCFNFFQGLNIWELLEANSPQNLSIAPTFYSSQFYTIF